MKRVLSVLFVIAMTVAGFTTSALADTTPSVKNNNNGTVTLEYNYSYNNRVKVLVSKDSKYQYELKTGNNKVVLPLTEGDGKYTIKVCKNVEGTKYSVIYKTTIEVKDSSKVFSVASMQVNYTKDSEVVKKAAELCKGLTTDEEKLIAVRNYVKSNFKYDYNKINTIAKNTTYVPNADKTLSEKTGICCDFATVVATMLRSQGVEVKVVEGYSTFTGDTFHAWNQVKINGEWKTVDLTYDIQIAKASLYKNYADYSNITYQF